MTPLGGTAPQLFCRRCLWLHVWDSAPGTCLNPSNPVFICSVQINGCQQSGRAGLGFGSGASVDGWVSPSTVNLILCWVLFAPVAAFEGLVC